MRLFLLTLLATISYAQTGPYYAKDFGDKNCPPGEEITSFEDCMTAIASLPNALMTDSQYIAYSGVPRYCTKHVHASGKNQVYFNTASSGDANSDYAPICKQAQCQAGYVVEYTGNDSDMQKITGTYTKRTDCGRSEGGAWFGGADFSVCFEGPDSFLMWNTGCGWEIGRMETDPMVLLMFPDEPDRKQWERYARTYSGICSQIPQTGLTETALSTSIFLNGFGDLIVGLSSSHEPCGEIRRILYGAGHRQDGYEDPCAGVKCPSISQCHLDGVCTNGICSEPFAPQGTACNDGDKSTVEDVCNGSGACFGNTLSPTLKPTTATPSAEPTANPTACPTPEVGLVGGHVIDATSSSVKQNGRVHLDFSYSSTIVTDLNVTMDNPDYSYTRDDSNGWDEEFGMCWDSVSREFTYNSLQKAADFHIDENDVMFAVETEYEYEQRKSFTINGITNEWTETYTRSKKIPFKMSLPETSAIAVAFSSNQKDLSGGFTIGTLEPSKSPSTSPSIKPTSSPTATSPTLSPSASDPSVTPTEIPSHMPTTNQPSSRPTYNPSVHPSVQPSQTPTKTPTTTTTSPSMRPSVVPTVQPSQTPSKTPSSTPSEVPSLSPSVQPTTFPSSTPTKSPISTVPSVSPTTEVPTLSPSTEIPTTIPSLPPSNDQPSLSPSTDQPTTKPTSLPISTQPTAYPTSDSPSIRPTRTPSTSPSSMPTTESPSSMPTTESPSVSPTRMPTVSPSVDPTALPSRTPSKIPSRIPSMEPSLSPSTSPSVQPTTSPSKSPTEHPTAMVPTISPTTEVPSVSPTTEVPTTTPTEHPTNMVPTISPTTEVPSTMPTTDIPTVSPSTKPTVTPSTEPSITPTTQPTAYPTSDSPSIRPTRTPSTSPSSMPTTESPSVIPTRMPSVSPSVDPTALPSRTPSKIPSRIPSTEPSLSPSVQPTAFPSSTPTKSPIVTAPSVSPTTEVPTLSPSTEIPTTKPTLSPSTDQPSLSPSTDQPTAYPTSDTPTATPTSISPSTHPTVRPSTTPSSSPEVSSPSVSPTFSSPSVTPTELPSTNPSVKPSQQPTKTPTTIPSFSPSTLPTSSPSVKPSGSFPSAIPTTTPTVAPSRSPLPPSEIVSTIIPDIAVEARRPGENPLITIQFTTIIKAPWFLVPRTAEGSAITGGIKWDVVAQGECTQFSELPSFLRHEALYCQSWNLQFEGDTHCNNDDRKVKLLFDAAEPSGQTSRQVDMSWDLDLGSSSAFECAQNLGEFQISLQIEGSSGGNKNFDTPGVAFLDDWYYFRVGASAGAPVTGVSIKKLAIQSASGEFLCEDCATNDELGLGISDWNPDNFIVHLLLDRDMFEGHLTVSFSFTFEVKMSALAGRRRMLQDGEQQVEQKVTIRLQPGSGKRSQTRPPTQANPDAPTLKPVEKVSEIEAVKDVLPEVTTSLNSPKESSKFNFLYVAIGAVSFIILGGAAYSYHQYSTAKNRKNFDLGSINPKPAATPMSPSLSIQSAIFKQWSPKAVAAAIE